MTEREAWLEIAAHIKGSGEMPMNPEKGVLTLAQMNSICIEYHGTYEQLQAAARLARQAALEEAAKECDKTGNHHARESRTRDASIADECAGYIRALARKEST